MMALSPLPWERALAQQPLIEDRTGQPRSFFEQTDAREAPGGSLMLFNQVQQHEEEIRRLRGQIEELRHQLEQLRRQTREQYLDLEERLADAAMGIGAGVADSAGSVLVDEQPIDEQRVDAQAARQVMQATPTVQPLDAPGPDVRESYQDAFALVQAREFAAAIDAFERFIDTHPPTTLTANAHYWLGELHAAEGSLGDAEREFRIVLDDFPQSNKVADSLYKLGLLKMRQGEATEGRALLERLRDEHPESTAAGLAGDFLRQSGN